MPNSGVSQQKKKGLALTYINVALHNMQILTTQIADFQQQDGRDLSQYLLTVIGIIMVICNNLTSALSIDIYHSPVEPELLLERLNVQVELCNGILQTRTPPINYRVTVSLAERRVEMKIINISPLVPKKTSDYLKELSLVQDLTVHEDGPSCECTICFDDVSAKNAIFTSCSHGFCGTCIKRFATSIKDMTKKPSCPMCRAEITELKMGNLELYNEISNHITVL